MRIDRRRTARRLLAAFLAIASPLLPTACADDGSASTGPDGRTSAVTVLLTDQPGELAHAWVDIRQVYLQGGDAAGRTVLFDGPTGPIDLLELVDDFQALAADVDVPAGTYGQLRVVIDGAAVETADGEIFATGGFAPPGGGEVDGEIVCPSCDTSGFKVVLQGRELDLVDGLETLILDFEVDDSFARPVGPTGRWMVHPTIRLYGNPEDVPD